VTGEPLSYVLPVRSRPGDGETAALTDYLEWLSTQVDLIVVDGSDAATFAEHHVAWGSLARHVPPAPDLRCANGKVWGVLTGIRIARHERVVIADDDIRYDGESLERVGDLLGRADLVRPQNYFEPLPWHARWDTARILINRALGNDFPGTLGIRRSFLRAAGGYDGDVLFENLELIRTVRAAGGRIVDAPSLFIPRLPPTAARFWEQRPRQAYDDWAQPAKFVAFLAAIPALLLAARSKPRAIVAGAGLAVLTANAGRLRHGGANVFDPLSTLFAPIWFLERSILAWVALVRRVLGGGCPYAGSVIPRAATPSRQLKRRFRPRSSG
jgi:hypothetical protein